MVLLLSIALQISPILLLALLCLIGASFVKRRSYDAVIRKLFIQTSLFFICSSVSFFIYLSFPEYVLLSSAAELLGLIFFGIGMVYVVLIGYKIWRWISF
jgi:uncharacterized membrane protein YhfC